MNLEINNQTKVIKITVDNFKELIDLLKRFSDSKEWEEYQVIVNEQIIYIPSYPVYPTYPDPIYPFTDPYYTICVNTTDIIK